jgi:uncharacterized membrane protein YraQ (UPF0718 family)
MAVEAVRGQRGWQQVRREILALAVAAALIEVLLKVESQPLPSTSRIAEIALERLQTFATIFLGIFLEALPFLLLGALVAGVIRVYVNDALLKRLASRGNVWSALLGGCLGMVFPACECGAVAVGRRLLGKGAPLSLGIAFMLAAPVVNPLVLASTWTAFGPTPGLVAARLGIALVVAVAIALAFSLYPSPSRLLAAGVSEHGHQQGSGPLAVLRVAADEFRELAPYLVIGGLGAAVLQTFVPRTALVALGQDPVLSVAVMMLLAVLLSVCSSVDAFIALSFAGTFSAGALLAFMLFGPIVNLKSAAMYGTALRGRAIVLLIVLSAQLVFLAGITVNLNVT